MKNNLIRNTIFTLVIWGCLSGCSKQENTHLVNTITFNSKEIQSINLDYDAEDISVFFGEYGSVTIKEYMNHDKKEYYAKTRSKNNTLFVTEGKRPRRASFESYVELYIPQDYDGGLTLHSTSGTISSSLMLQLTDTFGVDTTSGTIAISNIYAPEINITATSGKVEADQLRADKISVTTTSTESSFIKIKGEFSYKTTSGNLSLSDYSGYGSFYASGGGNVEVSFVDLAGNVSMYSKNGDISVLLPSHLKCYFSAASKEGKIETNFGDRLEDVDSSKVGVIGGTSEIVVELETRNGDIRAFIE